MKKKLDNLILGITSDITKSTVVTVLKDVHNQVMPIGSPGIVNFDSFKTSRERAKFVGNAYNIEVSFPFPIRTNMHPYALFNIKYSDIVHFAHKQQPVLSLKTVDDLNIVDSVTSIKPGNIKCFRYNDIPNSIGLLGKIGKLRQEFKYHSVLNLQYHNNTQYMNESYTGYVTVFDISTIIPIFDARRVDGVGINITLVYNNNSYSSNQVLPRFNLSVLFTNFRENVFEIDGCTVIIQKTLQGDIDRKYRNIIENCIEENSKYKNFKKEKKGLTEIDGKMFGDLINKKNKKKLSINCSQETLPEFVYTGSNMLGDSTTMSDTSISTSCTNNSIGLLI